MLPNRIYSLPAPLFLQSYNAQELEMDLYDIISILLLGSTDSIWCKICMNGKMGCPISKLCVIYVCAGIWLSIWLNFCYFLTCVWRKRDSSKSWPPRIVKLLVVECAYSCATISCYVLSLWSPKAHLLLKTTTCCGLTGFCRSRFGEFQMW